MRDSNIGILEDTLSVFDRGTYMMPDKTVKKTKLGKAQAQQIQVFLPDEVRKIRDSDEKGVIKMGRVGVGCENMDSFMLARQRYTDCKYMFREGSKPILVLNLANPVNPGGGVRRGAKAQEEDLCRKSSLLLSLESLEANKYYRYNASLGNYMGSDAVMVTPQVEIIKDENGDYLEDSVIVSVMTCAAPMLCNGLEGLTEQQYMDMMYNRICGMFAIAGHLGYEILVLGAFGCGAFKNDAKIVSDLFYKAMKEYKLGNRSVEDIFRRIDFAVFDHSSNKYNYNEFNRNFADFYRNENQQEIDRALKKLKETEKDLDKIRGSMFGGAVGDALGYAVEFLSEEAIFGKYGKNGITEFELDPLTGKALISDDTQMTLFTANGILIGNTRGCMRGIEGDPHGYVGMCYADWLKTQLSSYEEINKYERFSDQGGHSWLLDVPELFARRAPGNTCLSALRIKKSRSISEPINGSKGCGGIMRAAPLALMYGRHEIFSGDIAVLDKEGAEIAALTHGHSLGYMPAAVLTHILIRIIGNYPEMTLKNIVIEARDKVSEIFAGEKHLNELVAIINRALEYSENNESDLDNIHRLGEGWVAEETLAIAIYCSLKYENDFSKAVITAVNHKGDSDSTGAVTGNIVGLISGYEMIENKWKHNLELSDVILEVADDLCHTCQMSEYSHYHDPVWTCKYMAMHRYNAPKKMISTFFWNENEENGYMSNWYPSKFVIDDFEYLYVEQYLMSQKAKLFHDSKAYTAILKAGTPKECKVLGRSVVPFDSKKWNIVKYEVLKAAVRAKFEQNETLKSMLLDTGNSVIAEANPYDDIWGIGMDADSAAASEPKKWKGQNLLGIALMEVRSDLRNEVFDINRYYQTPAFDNMNRMLRDGLI